MFAESEPVLLTLSAQPKVRRSHVRLVGDDPQSSEKDRARVAELMLKPRGRPDRQMLGEMASHCRPGDRELQPMVVLLLARLTIDRVAHSQSLRLVRAELVGSDAHQQLPVRLLAGSDR